MVLVIAPLNTSIEDQIRYLRGKELSVGALQTKKSSTNMNIKPKRFDFESNSETDECSDNEQNKDFVTTNCCILKMENSSFFFCTQKGLYHVGKAEKSL